jgi:hypothetical protein
MGTGLRRAAFATVALAVAAVACRQLLDIGPEPRTDFADSGVEGGVEAGPGCGVVYAGTQCQACMESQCCSYASACAADPTCNGLQTCLATCGADGGADPTCRAACASSNQIGANAPADELGACLAKGCGQECGLRCGGGSTFLDVGDASVACAACIAADLCQVATTCATESECQAIFGCLWTPYDPNHVPSCLSEHEAGVDAAEAVIDGLSHTCLSACATDNQWRCVGSDLPPAWTQPTAVTLSLFYLSAQAPDGGVADASVTLCNPFAPPCTAVASGTTGASGQVTISAPPQLAGAGGSGYFLIDGAGLIPELYYWGFPLGGSSQSWGVPVVQQALDAGPPPSAIVVATAVDCLTLPASGVDFSMTPDASQASATFAGVTFVVFFDVPTDAGSATLTVVPKALGRPSSVVPVFVQPGMVTGVLMQVNQ